MTVGATIAKAVIVSSKGESGDSEGRNGNGMVSFRGFGDGEVANLRQPAV